MPDTALLIVDMQCGVVAADLPPSGWSRCWTI
jgi:hypothetical protein